MMALELQILLAFALDRLIGDPPWLPHPVRLIGRLALVTESPLRRCLPYPHLAGLFAWIFILTFTAIVAWMLLIAASLLHPWAADVVSIYILYTCLACKDLRDHSLRVHDALQAQDLPQARRDVQMLVGRDTDRLDEPEIVRATVESVAENMVDGVTAPLFFAALGGPVGAIVYKAINTLDSTFGYKNERYQKFGWASARLDDVANFFPSRLTAPLVAVAAWLLKLSPSGAWRICLRDGHKHPSPNSGLSEAAVAGALGVRLGGLNFYGGTPSHRPQMGDDLHPLDRSHILQTNRLMLVTSLLAMAIFLVGHRLLILP